MTTEMSQPQLLPLERVKGTELVPGQLADVLEGRYTGETVGIIDVGAHGWVVCELPMKDGEAGEIISVHSKHLRPWQFVQAVYHPIHVRVGLRPVPVKRDGPGYKDERAE